MNQIKKHTFEAVSLLTPDNGMLGLTIVPAMNQPDWVIPTNLILSVEDCDQHLQSYVWQEQKLSVFHLCLEDQAVDKVIILEGNTVAHRLVLQTKGELRHAKFRISDVKDIELPKHYIDQATTDFSRLNTVQVSDENEVEHAIDTMQNIDTHEEYCREDIVLSYLYQAVAIDNTPYLVPDLDKIAYHLVDLSAVE